MTESLSMPELSYATFAQLLHSTFRVRDVEPPVELALTEATVHGSAPQTNPAGTFSLVFTGPLNAFLQQRTYLFEHKKLGGFQLFIVPIGQDQKGFRYEAIFNRPVQPQTP